MKKIATLLVSAIAVLGIGVVALMPTSVYAAPTTPFDCSKAGSAQKVVACGACQAEEGSSWDSDNGTCTRASQDLSGTVKTVINVMLFIIGILSVIMIVYGGIRYTISRGKQEDITSAKNTIMYAVVGLVVAILAFSIVNFVVGNVK